MPYYILKLKFHIVQLQPMDSIHTYTYMLTLCMYWYVHNYVICNNYVLHNYVIIKYIIMYLGNYIHSGKTVN